MLRGERGDLLLCTRRRGGYCHLCPLKIEFEGLNRWLLQPLHWHLRKWSSVMSWLMCRVWPLYLPIKQSWRKGVCRLANFYFKQYNAFLDLLVPKDTLVDFQGSYKRGQRNHRTLQKHVEKRRMPSTSGGFWFPWGVCFWNYSSNVSSFSSTEELN